MSGYGRRQPTSPSGLRYAPSGLLRLAAATRPARAGGLFRLLVADSHAGGNSPGCGGSSRPLGSQAPPCGSAPALRQGSPPGPGPAVVWTNAAPAPGQRQRNGLGPTSSSSSPTRTRPSTVTSPGSRSTRTSSRSPRFGRRRPVARTGGLHVAATNVFCRTAGGWRMVVHHGSPVARGFEPG